MRSPLPLAAAGLIPLPAPSLTRSSPHLACRDKAGERDVYNEKPTRDEMTVAAPAPTSAASLARRAVIHTTLGDIKLELFPDLVPKTVENFVGLAKKHYYDQVIFHRVIPKFVRSRACHPLLGISCVGLTGS